MRCFLAAFSQAVGFLLQFVESLVHSLHHLVYALVGEVGVRYLFVEGVLYFNKFCNAVHAVLLLQTVDGVEAFLYLLLAFGRVGDIFIYAVKRRHDVAQLDER